MNYWFVNQNKTKQEESNAGIIWAPQKNQDGRTFYHWENVKYIKKDDVVVHYSKNEVYAVSIAEKDAYNSDNPIKSNNPWERLGYEAKLSYIMLKTPIEKRKFASDLYKLNLSYGPINSNYELNMGYLFKINEVALNIILKHLSDDDKNRLKDIIEYDIPRIEAKKKEGQMIIKLPKPFLLLAGISGTGKTRFVREQAKASRKDLPEGYNYHLEAVRPDWHEPSDLLGYISRLTGKTEYIPTGFLKFLLTAWLNCKIESDEKGIYVREEEMVPFWLCLDEMNLAPVEQYFADYLSILETREWKDNTYRCDPLIKADIIGIIEEKEKFWSEIKKGLSAEDIEKLEANKEIFVKHGIPIPPNLIVAGTVNMDETTHAFSRKVIDRALTIDFGEFFPNDFDKYFEASDFFTLSLLHKTSVTKEEENQNTKDSLNFLNELNSILKGTPFELAYRALNELYLSVIAFNPENSEKLQAVWDDYLMMKVLPRIEGDGEKLSFINPGIN